MTINRSKLVVLHLILIFTITSLYNQNNSLGLIPIDDRWIYNISNYDNLPIIDPIVANSNAELDLYVQNNNLTGNGTSNFPYIIDSVLINGLDSDFVLSMTKITKYLTIKSSYFLGGILNSVRLSETANLYLFNNTMDRTPITSRNDCCENQGILLLSSANITIEQNIVGDTFRGILSRTDNSEFLNHFGNHAIINNTIYKVQAGIIFEDSMQDPSRYKSNKINYNFVTDSSVAGIWIHVPVHGNTIFGNKLVDARSLSVNSKNNSISYNSFEKNTDLRFNLGAANNIINNNTMETKPVSIWDWGVNPPENNTFRFNNFKGTSHIDHSSSVYTNIFENNYYFGHDQSDLDEDGFADSKYSILDGNVTDIKPLAGENQDTFESLNLKFRPYPGYEEASTTTSSFITSTKSTTTLPSTSTDLSTSIPSTTSPEIVTVTIVETLEQSTEIETTDNSTTGPRLVGNSNQFVFVMLSLFSILILKRPEWLQAREYKQK